VDSPTRPPADPERPAAPLVSIVVPVYNGASYLRESLDSLLRQSYTPVEILVWDDASTDETPAIIASYGDRVRAFRQPANRGIYANANDGITVARGEFIAVYHADDVYHPRIVEREVAFLLEHPQAGAVFCLDVFVDADNREYGRLELPPHLKGRPVLDYAAVLDGLLRYKNRFLMCPGAMVRAAAYREVGRYDQERFRNTADLEMWLRIARRRPLGLLEEYLFRYRHFPGQSSRRYHTLRTTPENFFGIVDLYLAEDGRALVSAAALACYEGHRAEDRLKIAVSHYIRGERAASRAALGAIAVGTIRRGRTLQRWRLVVLLLAFRLLARVPRVAPVAELFRRRWFEKRSPLGAR
jgi:glycosyltransferase involved in cell wall biosynthesis